MNLINTFPEEWHDGPFLGVFWSNFSFVSISGKQHFQLKSGYIYIHTCIYIYVYIYIYTYIIYRSIILNKNLRNLCVYIYYIQHAFFWKYHNICYRLCNRYLIFSVFGYLVCIFGRSAQNFRLLYLIETDLKSLLRCCDKLRQWNKQTVVEHYRSILYNNHGTV